MNDKCKHGLRDLETNLPYCKHCDQESKSELAPSPGSANSPGVDVAHQWLNKSREDANGPISQWTTEEMDRYHIDLGLLVDFVTDCWPNDEVRHRRDENQKPLE